LKFVDAIIDLEKRGIMPDSTPALTLTRQALEVLKLPLPNRDKIVVVSGTNGKGSTCAVLENLIRHTGARTGFYSSPHLISYCERIKVDGKPISEKLFADAYEYIANQTKNISLTHFEVLTLMAIWIFCGTEDNPSVDWIILEVGLGGTWDATNAVPHGVSVISKIDYDHQNLLGSTLSEIAKNKLGIIEPNSVVIHQPFPDETEALVRREKESRGGRWFETPHYPFHGKPGHPPEFFITTPWGVASQGLAGARGAENTSLALTVFEKLGFDPSKHLSALSGVQWPGRMELIEERKGAPIYASGDHNPQGIASLISLLEFYPRNHLYMVVGIGKEKDIPKILEDLFTLKDTTILLTETPFRGAKLNQYGKYLELAAYAFESPSQALEKAKNLATTQDMILVTGSLYLVGALSKK
jgi:dihydrofolate synthase/folylpolyglutamate synthase